MNKINVFASTFLKFVFQIVIPSSDGSYIQPAVDNAWVGNNVWADVRCVCGHSQPKSGLIRCPKCRFVWSLYFSNKHKILLLKDVKQ